MLYAISTFQGLICNAIGMHPDRTADKAGGGITCSLPFSATVGVGILCDYVSPTSKSRLFQQVINTLLGSLI